MSFVWLGCWFGLKGRRKGRVQAVKDERRKGNWWKGWVGAVVIGGSLLVNSPRDGLVAGAVGDRAGLPPPVNAVKDYDAKLNKAIFEEAWGAIYTMFYDRTAGERYAAEDWRAERQRVYSNRSLIFSSRERTYDAIRDLVSAIGDPYTRFLTPDEFAAEVGSRSASALSSAGVGLQLIDPFDGVEDLQVMAPLPESPAEQAGISPGDSIVAIDDIDVAYSHMTPDEAIAILRGPEGSFVKLGVVSATAKKQHPVELKRRPLHIKPLKSEIIESEYGRFGYIRIHFFISSAREDMIRTVQEMTASGVDGIVVDVRNCLGGVFQEALGMASMFFERPETVLVYTLDANGESILRERYKPNLPSCIISALTCKAFTPSSFAKGIEREHTVEKQQCLLPGLVAPTTPLTILINGGSASSSEVLAVALQESGRAKLIGETTFGKGLIQHTFPLRDGSAVTMTVAEYLTPKHHRHVQNHGVAPDLLCRAAPTELAADDPCVTIAQKVLGHTLDANPHPTA